MMRQTLLVVRGNTFDILSIRPDIEDIARCFGEYLSLVGTGGAGSKHRALGAVGKALQHARVVRGDALFGYARRIHEQMTKQTFPAGVVTKLDEGLRKLDELLTREGVPARASRDILDRVDYATYYDVRRRGVEFQEQWKQFARKHSEQLGIDANGELPWFSKQKLAERGPEWAKVADEYLASLRAPAPTAVLEIEAED